MGALTSKPYSFSQRPWEVYVSLANPIFNALGVYFRIEFDRGKVTRVLPTRFNSMFWVSDYIRLFVKNISNNYFLRRIFSHGSHSEFFTVYRSTIFPPFLYEVVLKQNLLQIFYNYTMYTPFFNLETKFSFEKEFLILWHLIYINELSFLNFADYLVFYNFFFSLRFIIYRFILH
jgi:hypothetical protein